MTTVLPMFYCSRSGCNEAVYKLDPTANVFCPAHVGTPDSLVKKGRGGRVNRRRGESLVASAPSTEMEVSQTRSKTRKVMAEKSQEYRHTQRLTNTNTNTQEEFDELGNLRRRSIQQVQQTHEAEDLRSVSERLVAEEKQEVAQHLKQFYEARQSHAQQYPLLVTQEFHKLYNHCRDIVTMDSIWDTFLAAEPGLCFVKIMDPQLLQDVLKNPSLSYMEDHDTNGPLHCLILYLLFTATPQNRTLYEKLPLLFHVFHLNDEKVVLAQWHLPVGGTNFVSFSNKVPLSLLERYISVRPDFKSALGDYVSVHVADQQRQIDISTERAKGFAMQVTGSVSGLRHDDHDDQEEYYM